jgi:hypothetical protein
MGHTAFGRVPDFFGGRACPMENQTIFHAWGTLGMLALVSAITQ